MRLVWFTIGRPPGKSSAGEGIQVHGPGAAGISAGELSELLTGIRPTGDPPDVADRLAVGFARRARERRRPEELADVLDVRTRERAEYDARLLEEWARSGEEPSIAVLAALHRRDPESIHLRDVLRKATSSFADPWARPGDAAESVTGCAE